MRNVPAFARAFAQAYAQANAQAKEKGGGVIPESGCGVGVTSRAEWEWVPVMPEVLPGHCLGTWMGFARASGWGFARASGWGFSRASGWVFPGPLDGVLPGHLDGVLPGHMDGVLPGHMDGVLPGHLDACRWVFAPASCKTQSSKLAKSHDSI